MDEILIYTDGGCSGNPGPGGWAYVILANSTEEKASGGESDTTNNRMELKAVINALQEIQSRRKWRGQLLNIYTDSQYVKNGITLWIKKWEINGWKTASKKPVKNRDLWIELNDLSKLFKIAWHWVRGHAGNKYNELCDSLVQSELGKKR